MGDDDDPFSPPDRVEAPFSVIGSVNLEVNHRIDEMNELSRQERAAAHIGPSRLSDELEEIIVETLNDARFKGIDVIEADLTIEEHD